MPPPRRNSKLNKSFAFTLAEVLITLGIIGIVAALTLPLIIQNHKKQVVVTKLKKTYAIIKAAENMAIAEYGDIENWEFTVDSAKERGAFLINTTYHI